MSILGYTRKNKGLVLHEWDYEIKDSKLSLTSDVDKTRLNTVTKHTEKIWLRANQQTGTVGNLRIANYFFNNYALNERGVIYNIDSSSEFYQRQKVATKLGDLYYINLERLYDYSHNNKVYYDYHVQKYPVAGLVACNFVHNPDTKNLKYIEFIDGDRTNHHADNLRWTDKKSKRSLKILF